MDHNFTAFCLIWFSAFKNIHGRQFHCFLFPQTAQLWIPNVILSFYSPPLSWSTWCKDNWWSHFWHKTNQSSLAKWRTPLLLPTAQWLISGLKQSCSPLHQLADQSLQKHHSYSSTCNAESMIIETVFNRTYRVCTRFVAVALSLWMADIFFFPERLEA